jgi:hypothetical protein
MTAYPEKEIVFLSGKPGSCKIFDLLIVRRSAKNIIFALRIIFMVKQKPLHGVRLRSQKD